MSTSLYLAQFDNLLQSACLFQNNTFLDEKCFVLIIGKVAFFGNLIIPLEKE